MSPSESSDSHFWKHSLGLIHLRSFIQAFASALFDSKHAFVFSLSFLPKLAQAFFPALNFPTHGFLQALNAPTHCFLQLPPSLRLASEPPLASSSSFSSLFSSFSSWSSSSSFPKICSSSS